VWGYFIGFMIILIAMISESGSLFCLGMAVMIGFGAELSSAPVLGVVCAFLLYAAWALRVSGTEDDETDDVDQQIDDRADRAMEEGTKRVIFKAHELVIVKDDGVVVVEVEELGKDLCQECSQEETEECAICLEAFEDGEELTASGCGHYYHTGCFSQWVHQDGHHDMYASSGNMRCPVCRFEVMDGIGAPTPARIKHMRPAQRRLQNQDDEEKETETGAIPTAQVIATSRFLPMESIPEHFDDIDLDAMEAGMHTSAAPVPPTIWARMRAAVRLGASNGHTAVAEAQIVAPTTTMNVAHL